MAAGYTLGLQPSGRESLIVAIKGTFILPSSGEPPRLHESQVPLVLADTFTGAPGLSSPYEECDFAAEKGACDVLLNGSAYAPPGKAVERTRVALRVGAMEKSFDVVGDRVWRAGRTGVRASTPKAFTRQPISYDVAFGGTSGEGANAISYAANPVGRGFHPDPKNKSVDGQSLPNTEEVGRPVTSPSDKLRPMAFGPLGRGWQPRASFAGTYDERWRDEDFPFLPRDFDPNYYQAAPDDQQLPLVRSDLEVQLSNLTPDGFRRFVIPYFEASVRILPRQGEPEDLVAVLDTVFLEPDEERMTLTWRAVRPLRRSLFEIARVVVGRRGAAWWREQEGLPFPISIRVEPFHEER
jgi:hypothetical protein